MCLAVPGQIIEIYPAADPFQRTALIDFSGVGKTISLAYLPEAEVGDYVIVHAGVALTRLEADEAAASLQAFADLAAMGQAG